VKDYIDLRDDFMGVVELVEELEESFEIVVVLDSMAAGIL